MLSIPIGAYLASQQTTVTSRAKEEKKTAIKTSPIPSSTTPSALQGLSEQRQPSPTPDATPESQDSIPASFGPTLSLKVNFEGRPEGNQAGQLFVGIIEGTVSLNPKFLLSFTIDLPASGQYNGLSLAGLTPGNSYSALLKGPSQIASSSAFTMSPSITNLQGGEAITLLSGDLNEDNAINSTDYSIAQKSAGSTQKSQNWKENADFNKDSVINSLDLVFVIKNFGKIGASGSWTSQVPTATSSGSPGYWMWIPEL